MIPLSEAPWWAEQTVILLGAIVAAAAVVGSSWIQHRRQNVRLQRIEDSAKTTENHVANGTEDHQGTPLRNDLDKVIAANTQIAKSIKDLRHEFLGHVESMAAEQAKQTADIDRIGQQLAAYRDNADAVHRDLFGRVKRVESRDQVRIKWPWSR